MNTVAIVILYNPIFSTLSKLYQSVIHQVKSIVFVDNSQSKKTQATNQEWIEQLKDFRCHYLPMPDNLGIATAQNKGIEFAKTLNAQFVLLLDQDSMLPSDMVKNLHLAYQNLIDENKQVALVAPCFIDEKTGELAKVLKRSKGLPNKILPVNDPYIEVDYAIASGSLIGVDTLNKVGGMADELFIDWVDIEWAYRARRFGLLSYIIPSCIMHHSVGDDIIKKLDITLHSDFRNYFIVRNSVYLALYGDFSFVFRILRILKLPAYLLIYSYCSKRPFYSLKLLLTAIKDGVIKKMGKGHFENKGL